jgi:hypothetical protein
MSHPNLFTSGSLERKSLWRTHFGFPPYLGGSSHIPFQRRSLIEILHSLALDQGLEGPGASRNLLSRCGHLRLIMPCEEGWSSDVMHGS